MKPRRLFGAAVAVGALWVTVALGAVAAGLVAALAEIAPAASSRTVAIRWARRETIPPTAGSCPVPGAAFAVPNWAPVAGAALAFAACWLAAIGAAHALARWFGRR